MANTGKDWPRLAGLRQYLGVGTPPPPAAESRRTVGVPPVESLLVGANGRRLTLPPKLEPRRGGGEPPSPWLNLRPTVSSGLLARKFVLLSVNSRGFIGASRLTGDNPRRDADRFVELLLLGSDRLGLRGINGLLLRLLSLSFPSFSSFFTVFVASGSSGTVSIFSSCCTLKER